MLKGAQGQVYADTRVESHCRPTSTHAKGACLMRAPSSCRRAPYRDDQMISENANVHQESRTPSRDDHAMPNTYTTVLSKSIRVTSTCNNRRPTTSLQLRCRAPSIEDGRARPWRCARYMNLLTHIETCRKYWALLDPIETHQNI